MKLLHLDQVQSDMILEQHKNLFTAQPKQTSHDLCQEMYLCPSGSWGNTQGNIIITKNVLKIPMHSEENLFFLCLCLLKCLTSIDSNIQSQSLPSYKPTNKNK